MKSNKSIDKKWKNIKKKWKDSKVAKIEQASPGASDGKERVEQDFGEVSARQSRQGFLLFMSVSLPALRNGTRTACRSPNLMHRAISYFPLNFHSGRGEKDIHAISRNTAVEFGGMAA